MAFGLNAAAGLIRNFSSEIETIGALNQALQLLSSTVQGIISPLTQAVNAAEQFNRQILEAQIAYTVATKEINAFGEEVVSFADRMANSKTAFKKLSEEIEIETQTVVGLTSSRLNNVLNEVVQESGTILNQFTDKYGKNATDIFKKLTGNLSATYSLLGSPEYQDPQETRALLMGNVNDPNSFVAQKLNISQSEAAEAQSMGRYIDLLIEKTEAYRQASTLASGSLSNLTSNLQEISELISRSFGEPILNTFTKLGGSLFDSITTTQQNSINEIKKSAGKGVLAIDKDIQRNQEKLQVASSDTERESITQFINNLVKQRDDIIKQSTKKLNQLGVQNPEEAAQELVNENLSISGREKILKDFERNTIPDDTVVTKLVDFAGEFGKVLSELLEKISEILNKVGNILSSLNIDELIEGFSVGFIEGIRDSLNVIAGAINSVVGIVSAVTKKLDGIIGEFINIDSGKLIGYIASVAAVMTLLVSTTKGVIGSFSFLISQTRLLATAMTNAIGATASRTTIGGFNVGGFEGGIFTNSARNVRQIIGQSQLAWNAATIANTGGPLAALFTKLGVILTAIIPVLTAALPIILGVLGAFAAVAALTIGLNKLTNFLARQDLPEWLLEFNKTLRGATSGLIEFGKKIITLNGLIGGNKPDEKSLREFRTTVYNSIGKPIEDLSEIGGKEGFQRNLANGGNLAKDIQESFVDTYKEIDLILNGTEDSLKEAGKTDEEIEKILESRKDKTFVNNLKNQIDDLQTTYKDLTGMDLTGENTPIGAKYRGGISSTSLANMSKLNDYTSEDGVAGKGAETIEGDLDVISRSFDQLMQNNLLGTASLNEYADKFLEATNNELLTAENRMVFIDLYNKAIKKEMEITMGFIDASESILKSREKAGEVTKEGAALQRAELDVQRAKAALEEAFKTSKLENNLRSQDKAEAEKQLKAIENSSNKAINELPEYFKELADKTDSYIGVIDTGFAKIAKETFITSTLKQSKARGQKNTVEKKVDLVNFEKDREEFLKKTGMKGIKSVEDYLQAYESIAESVQNNNSGFLKNIQSVGNQAFAENLVKGSEPEIVAFIKTVSDKLLETTAFGENKFTTESKSFAENFIRGMSTEEEFKKLSTADQKNFATIIKESIMEFAKTDEFFNFNFDPLLKEYRAKFDVDTSEIKKQIEQLSAEVIIDINDKNATEKLKNLQKEREELRNKIELGEGVEKEIDRAKQLDLQIEEERNKIAKKSLNDRLFNLKSETDKLKSQITPLEDKEAMGTITEAETKQLETLRDQYSKLEKQLKSVDVQYQIIGNRQKLIADKAKLQADLQQVTKDKEKASPKDLKALESKEASIANRLSEIDKILNTDKLSEIESIKERIKGNEELSELSDSQLMAKSQEVLASQKILSIEKEIKAEREAQLRIQLNILDAQINLAKAQLKSAGTFRPELFQKDIAQEELNVQRQVLEDANNNYLMANKKLDASFTQIGGENLKNLYKQITADEPIINEKAFKKQAESLSGQSFDSFKEAFEFTQKSINKNINIDKILNADSLSEEVKKAYKFIFDQEISPDVDLKVLQNTLKRTKGAIVTGNGNAQQIGELASNLELGSIDFSSAINQAKELGVNISGISTKQDLVNALTQKYGELLGSQEIITSLQEQKKSYLDYINAQNQAINQAEKLIEATVAYNLEVSNGIRRQAEFNDLLDSMSGNMSDSEFDLNNSIRNFQNALETFNETTELKNIENLKKVLQENNLELNIEGLEKLADLGGISENTLQVLQNLKSALDQLESSVFSRLDSMFEKRSQAVSTLNALGSLNIGPQADLTDSERNLVALSTNTENAFSKLEASADFQKLRQQFMGLNEVTIDYSDLLGEISNVAQSVKYQLEGIVEVSVNKFEMANQKANQQLQIIQSLQQAYGSLARATDIYIGVANKAASKELGNLQDRLQSAPIDQDALNRYNKLKESSSKKFGGASFAETLKLNELREKSGIDKREEIEKRIQQIKERQIELENIQAIIALKRQEIENKILQLKNKQARIELFSERARIMGMEDSPQKQMMLKSNKQLLDINSLEGQLLKSAGGTISSAINLQKEVGKDGNINSLGALDKAISLSKMDAQNVDSISTQIDSMMSNFGMDDSEMNSILNEQQSRQTELLEKLSSAITPELFEQISSSININVKEEFDKLTTILNPINSNIANMSKNIEAIKNNFSAPSTPAPTPPIPPSKSPVPPSPANPQNNPFTTQSLAKPNGGNFILGYDQRGNPIITNQSAINSEFMNPNLKSVVGNISVDKNLIGGVSQTRQIQDFLGISEKDRKEIEENISKRKMDRLNEIRTNIAKDSYFDMAARTFMSPSLLETNLPQVPSVNRNNLPSNVINNPLKSLENSFGIGSSSESNKYNLDTREPGSSVDSKNDDNISKTSKDVSDILLLLNKAQNNTSTSNPPVPTSAERRVDDFREQQASLQTETNNFNRESTNTIKEINNTEIIEKETNNIREINNNNQINNLTVKEIERLKENTINNNIRETETIVKTENNQNNNNSNFNELLLTSINSLTKTISGLASSPFGIQTPPNVIVQAPSNPVTVNLNAMENSLLTNSNNTPSSESLTASQINQRTG